MPTNLARRFARLIAARNHCAENGRVDWRIKHEQAIDELCAQHLPHGSGLDAVVELVVPASRPERLVFSSDFHHMDGNGGYDGWTEHRVIVTPSLMFGFNLRITGRDRDGIKGYLYDVWQNTLNQEVE